MGRAAVSVSTLLAIDQLGRQIDREAISTREQIQAAYLAHRYGFRPHIAALIATHAFHVRALR
jgi:hypothetical protein